MVHDGSSKGTADWLGEQPTPNEIREALCEMPSGKATGEDGIMAEMVKCGG